ncbi:MAG: glycosyltransferase family 52 [Bacteroidia bacterium]|nr:glycosyltransferase family 52 [Bacteroidia bacterium]
MKEVGIVKNNVFICYTPLQILLSEKIIELENIDTFILIFYFEKDNAKSKYYFNKLSSKAKQAFYIKKNNQIFSALKSFCFLYLKLRKFSSPYNFFTGNIKSAYSRFIIYLLGFKVLYTFDDGIGNVCGDGYFYGNIKPSAIISLLPFLRLNFTYGKMHSQIKKHYSIYTLPNVMPNSTYVNLFNYDFLEVLNQVEKEIVILLTSTLHEEGYMKLEQEKALYNNITTKYNVTHVISHPLEKFKKIDNPQIVLIESEKIAEEIILNLRKEYTKIKVIGISSSALFNLKGMEGVEIINIHYNENAPDANMENILSLFNIETYYLS